MIPIRDQNPSAPSRRHGDDHRGVRGRVLAGGRLRAQDRAGLHLDFALAPANVTYGIETGTLRWGSAIASVLHLDVPPRWLAPPDREHVVPVDLRRQRRGHAGPFRFLALLSRLRARRGRDPLRALADLHRCPRSERAARSRACWAPTPCSFPAPGCSRWFRSGYLPRSWSCRRGSCSASGSSSRP